MRPFPYRFSWSSTLVVSLIALALVAPVAAQTLDGGFAHSVVLKPDGTVWTFGRNANGQLADNTTTNRRVPGQAASLIDVVAVASGAEHVLALTTSGTLYVWGDNSFGQIGDNSTTDRRLPVQSSLTNVVAIAAGEYHSVALTSNGTVYTWGRNTSGQLAIGSTTQSNVPVQAATGAIAIGAGFDHTLFVKTDGTAWAAGANGNAQLGDASTTQRTSAVQMSGVSNATRVAGGYRHSVVLLSDGTLKAAGLNSSNQLGDGTSTQRSVAVSVSSLTGVTALAVGRTHNVALTTAGEVWTWGANSYGQLGLGDTTGRSTATKITTLSGITKIGVGDDHSLAVTTLGVVLGWGQNNTGQVGDGTDVNRVSPVAISDEAYAWRVATPTLSVGSGTYNTDRTVTVAVVTAGATIRYTRNGVEPTTSDPVVTSGSTLSVTYSQTLTVKAWKSGMPDSQTAAAVYTMKVAQPYLTPAGGTYTTAQTVTVTSSTPGTTFHYTTDGSTPTTASAVYTAPLVLGTSTALKVVGVKTNWSDSDLRASTFTMNFGTLAAPVADQATGGYVNSVTLTLTAFTGAQIRYTTNNTAPGSGSTLYTGPLVFDITTTVRAKAFHPDYTASAETLRTFTLTAGTPVFSPTAGSYPAGQPITIAAPSIGSTIRYTLDGAEPTTSDPVITSGASLVAGHYTLKAKAWKTGTTVSDTASATYTVTGTTGVGVIDGGRHHTLALRPDGTAWAWGMNSSGQAGIGSVATPQMLPRRVAGLTGAVGGSAGQGAYSLAVRAGGDVRAWGENSTGTLGDGTTAQRLMPVAPVGLTTVVSVSAGDNHTVALHADGTVAAWGANAYGQIGDASTTTRLVPTALAITGVAAVAAGEAFSVALKQDGTVWTWGRNQYGQLATGNTTNSSVPQPVAGVSSVVAVSAGPTHVLAVLANGTAIGWGRNATGALGDGTTTTRLTPVPLSGLTNLTAVAAGFGFGLALDAAGTVWSWGGNTYGQLATGTTTDRLTPAAVTGLPAIVRIGAGESHAFAVAADGTVWAWGWNQYGQVGNGTTTNQLVPVAISGPGMSWRVPAPVLSVASGQYFAAQAVTVTISDPDAVLRYTLTGTDPTDSDAVVANGGAVAVTDSRTLKVSGWKTGAPTSVVISRAYELKVPVPTLTPGAGAYGAAQSVTIGTATSGVSLTYTQDGTEPSPSSPTYAAPVAVTETGTLKARGYRTGWTPSDSVHASYGISAGTVATPTITPTGGALTAPPIVRLATTTSGATIRYTLDGTTPNGTSAIYRYPFPLTVSATLKAVAFKTGFAASATASTTYDLDAPGATATPLIVPAGGWFAVTPSAVVTGPAGATLRYTLDGSDPTTSSPTVTSGASIPIDRSRVLKVRAWASGADPSAVRRADFVVTGAIATGYSHTLAVKADGTAWAWGASPFAQLGDGTYTTRLSPVAIGSGMRGVAASVQHSLAVKADGTVWAWGAGSSGRLGNGSAGGVQSTPGPATGIAGAIAVATGGDHSVVLKADGTVWAFGANSHGQLGDGGTITRTTAVQVLGLSGIVAIAAGKEASYALQADGAAGGVVWAWGRNNYSQLGDGSTLTRTTPTRVVGLDNIRALVASADGAAALRADGQVFVWGHAADGELGTGVLIDAATPVPVASLVNARLLGSGDRSFFAVDRSSRVWAWGVNAHGQLGVGVASQNASVTPQRSDFVAALALASAEMHTMAIHADGTVSGVGGNSGRLGNGGTATAFTPTPVPGFLLADNTWLLGDADADGLPTWREYLLGTDPLNIDTNGNGLPDGSDEASGVDPANPDNDGDDVLNWIERAQGTDPFRADTDGDGVNDGADAFPLDPTRWQAPLPTPGDTTPPIITLMQPVSARPVP